MNFLPEILSHFAGGFHSLILYSIDIAGYESAHRYEFRVLHLGMGLRKLCGHATVSQVRAVGLETSMHMIKSFWLTDSVQLQGSQRGLR